MITPRLDRNVLTDPSWWHWVVTIPLLGARLTGYSWAIWPAIVLCVGMGIYYLGRVRQWQPYPVQIRIAYTVLLIIGLVPVMWWVHGVQFFGTLAMVSVGYCPLARMLNLLPWNRTEPITAAFVFHNFLREPCAGGLIGWQSTPASAACCSLPATNVRSACSVSPADELCHE